MFFIRTYVKQVFVLVSFFMGNFLYPMSDQLVDTLCQDCNAGLTPASQLSMIGSQFLGRLNGTEQEKAHKFEQARRLLLTAGENCDPYQLCYREDGMHESNMIGDMLLADVTKDKNVDPNKFNRMWHFYNAVLTQSQLPSVKFDLKKGGHYSDPCDVNSSMARGYAAFRLGQMCSETTVFPHIKNDDHASYYFTQAERLGSSVQAEAAAKEMLSLYARKGCPELFADYYRRARLLGFYNREKLFSPNLSASSQADDFYMAALNDARSILKKTDLQSYLDAGNYIISTIRERVHQGIGEPVSQCLGIAATYAEYPDEEARCSTVNWLNEALDKSGEDWRKPVFISQVAKFEQTPLNGVLHEAAQTDGRLSFVCGMLALKKNNFFAAETAFKRAATLGDDRAVCHLANLCLRHFSDNQAIEQMYSIIVGDLLQREHGFDLLPYWGSICNQRIMNRFKKGKNSGSNEAPFLDGLIKYGNDKCSTDAFDLLKPFADKGNDVAQWCVADILISKQTSHCFEQAVSYCAQALKNTNNPQIRKRCVSTLKQCCQNGAINAVVPFYMAGLEDSQIHDEVLEIFSSFSEDKEKQEVFTGALLSQENRLLLEQYARRKNWYASFLLGYAYGFSGSFSRDENALMGGVHYIENAQLFAPDDNKFFLSKMATSFSLCLGEIYSRNENGPKAYRIYKQLADKGSEIAYQRMALMSLFSKQVVAEHNITAEEARHNFEYLEQCAETSDQYDDNVLRFIIGGAYLNGQQFSSGFSVNVDPEKAFNYLEQFNRCVQDGDKHFLDGKYFLGRMLIQYGGEFNVPQDFNRALQLFSELFEADPSYRTEQSIAALGKAAYEADNFVKAIELFNEVPHFAGAALRLGTMYLRGLGLHEANVVKACDYFEELDLADVRVSALLSNNFEPQTVDALMQLAGDSSNERARSSFAKFVFCLSDEQAAPYLDAAKAIFEEDLAQGKDYAHNLEACLCTQGKREGKTAMDAVFSWQRVIDNPHASQPAKEEAIRMVESFVSNCDQDGNIFQAREQYIAAYDIVRSLLNIGTDAAISDASDLFLLAENDLVFNRADFDEIQTTARVPEIYDLFNTLADDGPDNVKLTLATDLQMRLLTARYHGGTRYDAVHRLIELMTSMSSLNEVEKGIVLFGHVKMADELAKQKKSGPVDHQQVLQKSEEVIGIWQRAMRIFPEDPFLKYILAESILDYPATDPDAAVAEGLKLHKELAASGCVKSQERLGEIYAPRQFSRFCQFGCGGQVRRSMAKSDTYSTKAKDQGSTNAMRCMVVNHMSQDPEKAAQILKKFQSSIGLNERDKQFTDLVTNKEFTEINRRFDLCGQYAGQEKKYKKTFDTLYEQGGAKIQQLQELVDQDSWSAALEVAYLSERFARLEFDMKKDEQAKSSMENAIESLMRAVELGMIVQGHYAFVEAQKNCGQTVQNLKQDVQRYVKKTRDVTLLGKMVELKKKFAEKGVTIS